MFLLTLLLRHLQFSAFKRPSRRPWQRSISMWQSWTQMTRYARFRFTTVLSHCYFISLYIWLQYCSWWPKGVTRKFWLYLISAEPCGGLKFSQPVQIWTIKPSIIYFITINYIFLKNTGSFCGRKENQRFLKVTVFFAPPQNDFLFQVPNSVFLFSRKRFWLIPPRILFCSLFVVYSSYSRRFILLFACVVTDECCDRTRQAVPGLRRLTLVAADWIVVGSLTCNHEPISHPWLLPAVCVWEKRSGLLQFATYWNISAEFSIYQQKSDNSPKYGLGWRGFQQK